MAPARSILVIDDGDVGGLVGCAAAGEEKASGAKAAVFADLGHADAPRREQAIRRHAEIYGLEVIGSTDAQTVPVDTSGPASTRLLMAAGSAAGAAGLERVLWCVHHGETVDGESADLDEIARACDRALLASRLLSLDLETEVRIDVAYADFSDVQLIELAADLDAPLESCWWATEDKGSPIAAPTRQRWARAMDAAGLGDMLVN